MTELLLTARHFERTLEQDQKQKSSKLLALRLRWLQGQTPQNNTRAPPHCPLSGVYHPHTGPGIHVSTVTSWDPGKETALRPYTDHPASTQRRCLPHGHDGLARALTPCPCGRHPSPQASDRLDGRRITERCLVGLLTEPQLSIKDLYPLLADSPGFTSPSWKGPPRRVPDSGLSSSAGLCLPG